MTKKKTLIAVDVTDEADKVLSAGCDFAQRFESDVTLLTVVKPLRFAYGHLSPGGLGAQYAELEQDLVKQTENELCTLAEAHGLSPDHCQTVVGQPATEIRKAAQELSADTIVVGTRGRHGLALVLGSTANAVLHGAPCNVLAVRIQDED